MKKTDVMRCLGITKTLATFQMMVTTFFLLGCVESSQQDMIPETTPDTITWAPTEERMQDESIAKEVLLNVSFLGSRLSTSNRYFYYANLTQNSFKDFTKELDQFSKTNLNPVVQEIALNARLAFDAVPDTIVTYKGDTPEGQIAKAIWELTAVPAVTKTHNAILESKLRECWRDLVTYYEDAHPLHTKRSSKVGRVDIRERVSPNGPSEFELLVTNVSRQKLACCILAVEFQDIDRKAFTNYYFLENWKPDETMVLPSGVNWGRHGLNRTVNATLQVWSREVLQVGMEAFTTEFPEAISRIVAANLELAEAELGKGNYEFAIHAAERILKFEKAAEFWSSAARVLGKARAMRDHHMTLRSLLQQGAVYRGVWHFGRYDGRIDMQIDVGAQVSRRGMVFAERREEFELRFMRSDSPTEYVTWKGVIEFDPKASHYTASIKIKGSHRTKPNQPPSVKDLYTGVRSSGFTFDLVDKKYLAARGVIGDYLGFINVNDDPSENELVRLANAAQVELALPFREIEPVPTELISKPSSHAFDGLANLSESIRMYGFRRGRQPATNHTINRLLISEAETPVLYSQRAGFEVNCWDLESAEPQASFFAGDFVAGDSTILSPDGKILAAPAVIKGKPSPRAFDAQTGKVLGTINEYSNVLAFSPDSNEFVGGNGRGDVIVWATKGGKELFRTKMSSAITSVAISETHVFAAAADNSVAVWGRSNASKNVGIYSGHDVPVRQIRISSDGKRALTIAHESPGVRMSSSKKQQMHIWDIESCRTLYKTRLTGSIYSLDVSSDWKYLATGESDGQIHLWDLVRGVEIQRLAGHYAPPTAVTFAERTTLIASGGWDLWVVVWKPGKQR